MTGERGTSRLQLVVPCYNEAGRLPEAASRTGPLLRSGPRTDPVMVRAGAEVMFGYTPFILALPAA